MWIIIMVISAFFCYHIADNKWYNKWEWIIRWLLFGIFAILYYLIAPHLKKDLK